MCYSFKDHTKVMLDHQKFIEEERKRGALKYEILYSESIKFGTHTLYRIRALKNFDDVKIGDIGGYIESEKNLSHMNNCLVYNDAKVLEDAVVRDNAKVYNDALISEDAVVCFNARIHDNVKLYGESIVDGNAEVYGNVELFDESVINEHAEVYGNVSLHETANIRGNAEVSGNVVIRDQAEVYDNAVIKDNVKLSGDCVICGNAEVYDSAKIYDSVTVTGNAKVYGRAMLLGEVTVMEDAEVCKGAKLRGKLNISDNAYIDRPSAVLFIDIPTDEYDETWFTFFKTKDGDIHAMDSYDSYGSIDRFVETYKKHPKINLLVEFVKSCITVSEEEKR